MGLAQVIQLILVSSIFLSVFSLALRAKAADVTYLFREWRLGLRAFVALFVVVPAVAIAIAYSFDLNPAVKIAMVALAFSPIPPLLPKKQVGAGASASYTTGLMIAAALASLVIAPIGLAVSGHIFHVQADFAATSMATTLLITTGAPLVLGLVLHPVMGDRADGLASAIRKFATILLLASGVALLVLLAPAIWHVVGDGTIVALVAMIVAGLAAGYWLAGRVKGNRVALSLAAGARHPGIAIGMVTAMFPDAKLAPAAVVLFFLLSAVISIPYLHRLSKGKSSFEEST